jgi:hypothetical protein
METTLRTAIGLGLLPNPSLGLGASLGIRKLGFSLALELMVFSEFKNTLPLTHDIAPALMSTVAVTTCGHEKIFFACGGVVGGDVAVEGFSKSTVQHSFLMGPMLRIGGEWQFKFQQGALALRAFGDVIIPVAHVSILVEDRLGWEGAMLTGVIGLQGRLVFGDELLYK